MKRGGAQSCLLKIAKKSEKCDQEVNMVEFFAEESDSLDLIFHVVFADGRRKKV